MKVFFRNLGYKIRSFFKRQYINSYGMDTINKLLLYAAFLCSIVNIFIKSNVIYIVGTFLFIIYFYRYFSKNKIQRSAENRAFNKELKYLKLKKQYAKTHRIYKCKKCGQFIRVPKGAGSITTTCPSCGNKEDHKA